MARKPLIRVALVESDPLRVVGTRGRQSDERDRNHMAYLPSPASASEGQHFLGDCEKHRSVYRVYFYFGKTSECVRA